MVQNSSARQKVEMESGKDYNSSEKGWLWILGTHVSQVESENKHKRSRHAPEGQRAHSPGQRPGWNEAMMCALKGQKH